MPKIRQLTLIYFLFRVAVQGTFRLVQRQDVIFLIVEFNRDQSQEMRRDATYRIVQ